jgi:hypothetical protein
MSGLRWTTAYLCRAAMYMTFALITTGWNSERFFHYLLKVVSLAGLWVGYVERYFSRSSETVPAQPNVETAATT